MLAIQESNILDHHNIPRLLCISLEPLPGYNWTGDDDSDDEYDDDSVGDDHDIT